MARCRLSRQGPFEKLFAALPPLYTVGRRIRTAAEMEVSRKLLWGGELGWRKFILNGRDRFRRPFALQDSAGGCGRYELPGWCGRMRWQGLDSSSEERVQGDPRRPGGLPHRAASHGILWRVKRRTSRRISMRVAE